MKLWNNLHSPLAEAARNSFRTVGEIPDLGPTLKQAALGLAGALEGEAAAVLEQYAADLTRFEEGHEADRARLVALGLRLCAQCKGKVTADRPAAIPAETGTPGPASPVSVLKGVGPAIAARLQAKGLERVEDLFYLLPLEYQDCREEHALEDLPQGEPITVRGVVVKSRLMGGGRRRILEVGLGREPGSPPLLWAVWFSAYPGQKDRLPLGKEVLASGMVQAYRDRLQMVHPDVVVEPGPEDRGPVRRRYPDVEGVQPGRLERLIDQACQRFLETTADGVPESVCLAEQLMPQAEALAALHLQGQLPDQEEVQRLAQGGHPAHRRLVFDELFSMQLTVAKRRLRWGVRRALPCQLGPGELDRFGRCFPFTLTGGQEQVIGEILADMARPRPMHRLLQGDVGSGKTVVAFAAAWAAMARGYQAAIMAPTELLANQHHEVLVPWCRELGLEAALLTASTPKASRESMLALAGAGKIDLLIGTHSLLSARVQLPNLALAVIDEQHRFGVLQRARLREQGDEGIIPHLLVMTATPIPRSMALTLYGDLELSVLKEKPAGRIPPVTRVFPGKSRGDAYALVQRCLDAGQQAFVVCPLVEESDKVAWADAMGMAERLGRRFPDHRVGLVHGRLPPRERQAVMGDFRAGAVRLLVATTVIEVGIDVPEANVMVVEHAEQFGLAQLHQLRGRVGRGEEQAHCLLLTESSGSSPAARRLRVMAGSSDGFKIAQEDLEIRGPGELIGTRQAGLHRFRFADLARHLELLSRARHTAARVVEGDPELEAPENQEAKQVMERRWRGLPLLEEGAG